MAKKRVTQKKATAPRNRQLKEKDNQRLNTLINMFPGDMTEADELELKKLRELKEKYG